jgi:small subunit ribosomal protein S4
VSADKWEEGFGPETLPGPQSILPDSVRVSGSSDDRIEVGGALFPADDPPQLREKQRLRAQYGIREAQLKIQFEEARRAAGLTGENLVEQLEMRLDALIVRAAIARTTAQARQMIVHRHILVDGQRVDRPSFRVKPGQLIHVHAKSEGMEPFQVAAAGGHVDVLPKTPPYLEVEIDKLQARLVRRPKRAEVPVTCEVQLVVEYYAAR